MSARLKRDVMYELGDPDSGCAGVHDVWVRAHGKRKWRKHPGGPWTLGQAIQIAHLEHPASKRASVRIVVCVWCESCPLCL